MKTLLLLRHGKAQQAAPQGDHERTLIERGRRDSEIIGRKLASITAFPDTIVTSDARRAAQTASIAARAAGYAGEIVTEPDIYSADVDTLARIVRHLPDSANSALLVGHNPGFEELAAALAEEGTPPPDLPTAGLAHLEFNAGRWRDVRHGTGRLLAVYTPKNLRNEED